MVIIYCIYQQTDQNVLVHLARDKKLFFILLIEHQIFSYDLEAFNIYIQEHFLYLGLNKMEDFNNNDLITVLFLGQFAELYCTGLVHIKYKTNR